jgi:hypothetical protein
MMGELCYFSKFQRKIKSFDSINEFCQNLRGFATPYSLLWLDLIGDYLILNCFKT